MELVNYVYASSRLGRPYNREWRKHIVPVSFHGGMLC